ncbi:MULTISPECIES: hypothetical protein [Tsukamurella]|uniref:Uncharacterized protein n=2 Tax=Tsukamurella TaxID=2060 RepID=A0A138AW22_9ACTN|nr:MULTISPECIES: hypothetical protein [Tsukamurella]KXO91153.1 hypothetical protein AXK61_06165 [Tsukamurella pseudospumae]KXP14667.1 hypothetical protein AXK60_01895 [Tsukamurella pseudospumae]NKY20362.1 hypothetical protein [Tsukamurella spumae]
MVEPRSSCWDEPQQRPFAAVPADSVLTHLGKISAGVAVFNEVPLWREHAVERWVEVDVSMIEGAQTIEETVRQVRRRPQSARSRKKDCVRYFRAGDLMDAGYFPMRTPSIGIPRHVSVYGDMTDMMARADKDFGATLIDQAVHRWWWDLPGRATLESIELARRLP